MNSMTIQSDSSLTRKAAELEENFYHGHLMTVVNIRKLVHVRILFLFFYFSYFILVLQ